MFEEGSVVTCITCIRKDPSVIKLNHKRDKGPMFFRNELYTQTSCMATLNFDQLKLLYKVSTPANFHIVH